MKAKYRSIRLLLLASGVSTFLLAPRSSSSLTIHTMEGTGCWIYAYPSTQDWNCLMVGGSTQTTGVLGVYFDYHNPSPETVTLEIVRSSYTGSLSVDSKTLAGSVGQVDAWVPAKYTLANPSVWDYWWGDINGIAYPGSITGITMVVN
jgi:hypothetical protein